MNNEQLTFIVGAYVVMLLMTLLAISIAKTQEDRWFAKLLICATPFAPLAMPLAFGCLGGFCFYALSKAFLSQLRFVLFNKR